MSVQSSNDQSNKNKDFWNSLLNVGFLFVFIFGVILIGTNKNINIINRWYIFMGLMVLLLMVIGKSISNRLAGVLIDTRNKMSLARLQMIFWTIIGLSAFLVIGLSRIIGDVANPLNISFPQELLLAMGISVASFAGSSLVKGTKQAQDASVSVGPKAIAEKSTEVQLAIQQDSLAHKKYQEFIQKEIEAQQEMAGAEASGDTADIEAADIKLKNAQKAVLFSKQAFELATIKKKELQKQLDAIEKEKEQYDGLLHVNNDPKEAKWTDMFRAEEKNHKNVDLSKVQMFFFTIVVIFAYAVVLHDMLGNFDTIAKAQPFNLPDFDSSLVVLLGISHSGYLSVKAAPQTKTS